MSRGIMRINKVNGNLKCTSTSRYALNILSLTINRRVDYEVEGGRDLDLMHSRVWEPFQLIPSGELVISVLGIAIIVALDRMLNYKEHLSKSPHAQPDKNWIDMFVSTQNLTTFVLHGFATRHCEDLATEEENSVKRRKERRGREEDKEGRKEKKRRKATRRGEEMTVMKEEGGGNVAAVRSFGNRRRKCCNGGQGFEFCDVDNAHNMCVISKDNAFSVCVILTVNTCIV
ncbi:hypothetical protein M9H77_21544 [Catharanthus roseus]|uniref:Uncharacterized protein n=1 Tax=Catharanthus roseus TaxID=4058 RepID=A0ACC0ARY6_CATRO|nr:hypothetical protein M9H77_21544 [Catharanthus roseus]